VPKQHRNERRMRRPGRRRGVCVCVFFGGGGRAGTHLVVLVLVVLLAAPRLRPASSASAPRLLGWRRRGEALVGSRHARCGHRGDSTRAATDRGAPHLQLDGVLRETGEPGGAGWGGEAVRGGQAADCLQRARRAPPLSGGAARAPACRAASVRVAPHTGGRAFLPAVSAVLSSTRGPVLSSHLHSLDEVLLEAALNLRPLHAQLLRAPKQMDDGRMQCRGFSFLPAFLDFQDEPPFRGSTAGPARRLGPQRVPECVLQSRCTAH
jgi:hypothetical protein